MAVEPNWLEAACVAGAVCIPAAFFQAFLREIPAFRLTLLSSGERTGCRAPPRTGRWRVAARLPFQTPCYCLGNCRLNSRKCRCWRWCRPWQRRSLPAMRSAPQIRVVCNVSWFPLSVGGDGQPFWQRLHDTIGCLSIMSLSTWRRVFRRTNPPPDKAARTVCFSIIMLLLLLVNGALVRFLPGEVKPRAGDLLCHFRTNHRKNYGKCQVDYGKWWAG